MTTTGATSPADVPAFLRTTAASRTSATALVPRDAASTGPGRSGDSVSLSPMAAALKGNALTVFNEALTDDDRRTLDDAVRAGTLTGDDVAKGLTTRLKRVGFAHAADLGVTAVDLDLDAMLRRMDGSRLLRRGERRPDTEAPQDAAPIRTDKPATAKAPADPQRLAYFNAIDDGGDEAARKIAGLGVNLSPFAAFGNAVRRLIDRGAFEYG